MAKANQSRLNKVLSSREYMLHEMRHAADWGQSEEFVSREAKDVARILWRLGWRPRESSE